MDCKVDGAEFFKCASTLNVQVILNSLFEAESIECSDSAAVTTLLLYTMLAASYGRCDVTIWFSCVNSVICRSHSIRYPSWRADFRLHYSTKFDISNTFLNELTKSQVLFLVDVKELTHTLRAKQVLAAFFLKKWICDSGISESTLVNFCCNN